MTGCMLAAPHAGRAYPPELLDALRVPAGNLLRLEDRLADMLLTEAAARGYSTLIADTPRAMIDLNRPLADFDFEMIEPEDAGRMAAVGLKRGLMRSARARGGLGLVPRSLPSCGALWSRRLTGDEMARRITLVHGPYHELLSDRLQRLARRDGEAVLIDVHSMPPLPTRNGRPGAHIVIGDLHGTSAAEHIVDCIQQVAVRRGLRVARNMPYAGGHVLRRHGNPRLGVHAVQVEIDRRLYLDPHMEKPGPGMASMASMIAEMADAVSIAQGNALPEAAE